MAISSTSTLLDKKASKSTATFRIAANGKVFVRDVYIYTLLQKQANLKMLSFTERKMEQLQSAASP